MPHFTYKNYPKRLKKYYLNTYDSVEFIKIHGELHNPDNPIVFGYGDELEDNYKAIENQQDNRFM